MTVTLGAGELFFQKRKEKTGKKKKSDD